jgi:sortase A
VTGRASALRWVERLLIAVGVVCLGYYGYRSAEARQFQRQHVSTFESLMPAESTPDREAVQATSGDSGVLALLEIPRIGISTPVLSGDDDATLDLAVGHLPDTPKPWESGNSALAAHRDGLFRPLRNIRVGDEVRLRTLEGEFTYRVRETKVVWPTDLSVLEDGDTPSLTLITCYPFNFVGNAPKRFIVHADRLSATPQ